MPEDRSLIITDNGTRYVVQAINNNMTVGPQKWLIAALICAGVAAFVASILRVNIYTEETGTSEATGAQAAAATILPFGTVHKVPRLPWNSSDGWIDDLFSQGQPLIVTGSPPVTENWPIMSWTFEDIRQLKILPEVFISDGILFPYFDFANKLMDISRWQLPYTRSNMTGDTFVDCLKTGTNCPTHHTPGNTTYLYFSGPVQHNLMQKVKHALGDTRVLRARRPRLRPVIDRFMEEHIWMGKENVTSVFHYDNSHNTYLQVHGRKNFWLLPPTVRPDMYMYPKGHPASRHSDVPWTPSQPEVSAEEFPRFFNIKGVHLAALEPGDLLVMPTRWYHCVQAASDSISVNVWTTPWPDEIRKKALEIDMPFYNPSWPHDKIQPVLQYFVSTVIRAIVCPSTRTDCDNFYKDVVSRHDFATKALGMKIDHGFDCPSYDENEFKELLETPIDETLTLLLRVDQYVDMVAESWMKHFLFPIGLRDMPGFMWTCLCDNCDDQPKVET